MNTDLRAIARNNMNKPRTVMQIIANVVMILACIGWGTYVILNRFCGVGIPLRLDLALLGLAAASSMVQQNPEHWKLALISLAGTGVLVLCA